MVETSQQNQAKLVDSKSQQADQSPQPGSRHPLNGRDEGSLSSAILPSAPTAMKEESIIQDETKQFEDYFKQNPQKLRGCTFDQLVSFIRRDQPELIFIFSEEGKRYTPVEYVERLASNPQLREYIDTLRNISGYRFSLMNLPQIEQMMQEYPQSKLSALPAPTKELLSQARTIQDVNLVLKHPQAVDASIDSLRQEVQSKLSNQPLTSVFERSGKQVEIKPGSETYFSFNNFDRLSRFDLFRLNTLLDNLKQPQFRQQILGIISQDLANPNSELGGLMHLSQDGRSIAIQEVPPLPGSSGNSSYSGGQQPEFIERHAQSLVDFHLHALEQKNKNKGPSSNDVGTSRRDQRSSVVISSHGEGRFLVHFWDAQGNVIGLGEWTN